MAELTLSAALQQAIQHHQAGRLPEAETLYRAILARDPRCADALHYLGVIAHQLGRHDIAVELVRQAMALSPNDPEIYSNLGEAYRQLGRLAEAVANLHRALALRPEYPDALNNLGNALTSQGRLDDAIAFFRRALVLNPHSAKTHNNLGVPLLHQSNFDDALVCFRRALDLDPKFAGAYTNLGNLFRDRGQLDQAAACYQATLALSPRLPEAHNNLAGVLKEQGRIDEALASYRQALTLQPDRPSTHSNLVLALHYGPDDNAETIEAELRRWNERHARPLAGLIQPHRNDRSPDRRLRIGYFSHDLRLHSVAFFLLPLLRAHDRGDFHITCYSTNARSDDTTAQLRACTDAWRSLVGVSDDRAAQTIREDRIDLLVDLSGHTAGNRLAVFARKPAPIQVSYLGFPGAAGLDTIDYRLTDPWADPAGPQGDPSGEQRVRLPRSAWCFTPLSGQPPVGELPATRLGYLTFGCFNNFAKITNTMLQLWARLLQRVPTARLALKNQAIGSPSVTQRLQTFFGQQGISPDRIALLNHHPSSLAHLQCYDGIDLALDTFPYHGTTTTCEALWMGVPVLTLAGRRHISRVGVSLLTNAGLPEFVTSDAESYLETAAALSCDLPRLAALRTSLRERLQHSPLMDGPRLARAIESAYRSMWRHWCAPLPPSSAPSR